MYYISEAPNITRLCMLPVSTAPRPLITTTPKRSSTTTCICPHLHSSSCNRFAIMVNYGVVLLLCVVLMMAGSTTGVPMSPCDGEYQTATPPPYYTTTIYATTSPCTEVFKYYTTKAPEFCTTTYATLSHYNDALKYYSAPSYYTTKATEYYMTTHAAPSDYTKAPNCYTKTVEYYTEVAKYFSAPIYSTRTEAVKY
ncbi:uncharacterized protein LOC124192109 [Daphnia pulex]|uniref:uncharacterized protein LOC124192109 n=1 Tax=Daphnia pulex TaxID=6669 RepID=UPI001EDF722F|nr:uncharacterized protein LOC124192109 [Daphnia pulex]XP_046441234.1 uncharacterized protein LOC124192109 [Daphnia pulex]